MKRHIVPNRGRVGVGGIEDGWGHRQVSFTRIGEKDELADTMRSCTGQLHESQHIA